MSSEKNRETAEKTIQSYAAIGVAFVCIVIGIPLWWKTTEVYRVPLPYSEIDDLELSKANYKIEFTVVVFENSWNDVTLAKFGEKLKNEFQNIDFPGNWTEDIKYEGAIRKPYKDESSVLNKATSLNELDQELTKLRLMKEPGKYIIAILPRSSTLLTDNAALGTFRNAFLRAKQDVDLMLPMLLHVVRDLFVEENSFERIMESVKPASHQKDNKERMRSLGYHPGYTVTFTLLNPQPNVVNVRWNIKDAVNAYLQPFVEAFKDYTEIIVNSQYLYFTGLNIRPSRNTAKNFSYLLIDDLPHIINPIEAHLGYHVSTNPNLNFIVYIPSSDQSPLVILDNLEAATSSDSFLSPRWGGMMIYNAERPKEGQQLPLLTDVDMSKVMATFLSQLRLLLGVTPPNSNKGVVIQQPGAFGIAEWEMDKWLRGQTLQNIGSSTLTLKSLIRLLEEVGNIVINDGVGIEVNRAIDAIKECQDLMAKGNLNGAFLASRQAIISSEKAFFDQSLLELLYFPEDQKFAIYIPLFLPVSIPVILSFLQAIKFLKNKNKKSEKVD